METKSNEAARVLNNILGKGETEIWERQSELRNIQREAEGLSEEIAKSREAILNGSKNDRLLCLAARECGIIDSSPEGSLHQAELAHSIRLQADAVGIPSRGLTHEELVSMIQYQASLHRSLLIDQLHTCAELLDVTTSTARDIEAYRRQLDQVYVIAEAKVASKVGTSGFLSEF